MVSDTATTRAEHVLYVGSLTQRHSGASQWMLQLARRMPEHGWQSTAVLPDDDGIATKYRDVGVEFRVFPTPPLRSRRSPLGHLIALFTSLLATLRVAFLCRRERVDVVHVNDVRFAYLLVGGVLGGAGTVCHVRANFRSRRLRRVLGYLVVTLADEVVCVSDRTREFMFESVGHDDTHVRVVRDGLPSPERFDGLPDGTTFREEFGFGDEFLAVQVSKLTANKAQDRLLDAAAADGDFAVAIVGGSVEGHEGYARSIREQADRIDRVQAVGFYENLTTALAAADVVVHVPRHEDPFPGVVLEGMLSGTPVVGSRNGGIPEQLDGECGILVPGQDAADAIAEAILTLKNDPERRRKMGRRARQRALEEFSTDEHLRSIDAVYRRVVGVAREQPTA